MTSSLETPRQHSSISRLVVTTTTLVGKINERRRNGGGSAGEGFLCDVGEL